MLSKHISYYETAYGEVNLEASEEGVAKLAEQGVQVGLEREQDGSTEA